MRGGRRDGAGRKKTGSFEMRAYDYSIAAVDDFTAQKAKAKLGINWRRKIF